MNEFILVALNCAMLAMNMFMAHLLVRESAVNLEIAKLLFAAQKGQTP